MYISGSLSSIKKGPKLGLTNCKEEAMTTQRLAIRSLMMTNAFAFVVAGGILKSGVAIASQSHFIRPHHTIMVFLVVASESSYQYIHINVLVFRRGKQAATSTTNHQTDSSSKNENLESSKYRG